MEIPIRDKRIYKNMAALLPKPQVQAALKFLENDNKATIREQMEITSIPAPSFNEKKRGEHYYSCLENLGLKNLTVDAVGNVYGTRPGEGRGPLVAVFAHLDTVFSLDTPIKPKTCGGKIYAPGIADDGRGLAAVLTVLRALNYAKLETVGDLIFGATVCEEGLGDLKGVKYFCRKNPDISGFIALEPGIHGLITYEYVGSRRYRAVFKGPGGHSFNDFGRPSAVHAVGRAIASIAELKVPADFKTTFTVGLVEGGSSINSIAERAEMYIDLRSVMPEALLRLEGKVLRLLRNSVEEENRRWSKGEITIEIILVGDRPAGTQSLNEAVVQTAASAADLLGFEPFSKGPKGTDANIPISLGIPAITLGGGGDFGGVHSLQEWFDPVNAHYGPQHILLSILGLAGCAGVSPPLLNERRKTDETRCKHG